MRDGTPRTLKEAIEQAVCVGALSELEQRSFEVLKDFIAQKFMIAYLKARKDEKALKILKETFHSLTREIV